MNQVIDNKEVKLEDRKIINKEAPAKAVEANLVVVKEIRSEQGALSLTPRVTPKGNISYVLKLQDDDGQSLSASEVRKHLRESQDLKGNALTKAVNAIMRDKANRLQFVTSLLHSALAYEGYKLNRGRFNKSMKSCTIGYTKLAEVAETSSTSSQLLAETNRKQVSEIENLKAEIEALKASK